MDLAGLKVRMAGHSNRVHRKLASAYGLLTNLNCSYGIATSTSSDHMLQKYQNLLATDGHTNLELNMQVCKSVAI